MTSDAFSRKVRSAILTAYSDSNDSMKFSLIFASILFVHSTGALVNSSFVDFGTYLRSGIGMNSKGGDQVCFSNPGAVGNEFRVGNECTTYGELVLTTFLKRRTEKDPLYGYGQLRFAYGPPGNTNWEYANGDNPIAVRETYAEIGGIGKQEISFWVGNRFYRDQEMYMNDFFYFGDTSGNGGGIGRIPFFLKGKLYAAVLRETKTNKTDNGNLAMTLLDLRAKGMQLGRNLQLNLWFGHGFSSGGKDIDTLIEYNDPSGQVYGAILQKGFDKGFNHFAVVYGNGLLHQFNLFGDVTLTKGSPEALAQEKAKRLRIVDHLTYDLTDRFSFHFGTTLEIRDNGSDRNSREVWYNAGFHPVYFIDENFQLTGQIGTSVVESEGSPARRMTRLTFAPQVGLRKGIWNRPIIRAFYSRTFWSRSNRGQIGRGTFYENETSGTNIGLQMEIWF